MTTYWPIVIVSAHVSLISNVSPISSASASVHVSSDHGVMLAVSVNVIVNDVDGMADDDCDVRLSVSAIESVIASSGRSHCHCRWCYYRS